MHLSLPCVLSNHKCNPSAKIPVIMSSSFVVSLRCIYFELGSWCHLPRPVVLSATWQSLGFRAGSTCRNRPVALSPRQAVLCRKLWHLYIMQLLVPIFHLLPTPRIPSFCLFVHHVPCVIVVRPQHLFYVVLHLIIVTCVTPSSFSVVQTEPTKRLAFSACSRHFEQLYAGLWVLLMQYFANGHVCDRLVVNVKTGGLTGLCWIGELRFWAVCTAFSVKQGFLAVYLQWIKSRMDSVKVFLTVRCLMNPCTSFVPFCDSGESRCCHVHCQWWRLAQSLYSARVIVRRWPPYCAGEHKGQSHSNKAGLLANLARGVECCCFLLYGASLRSGDLFDWPIKFTSNRLALISCLLKCCSVQS